MLAYINKKHATNTNHVKYTYYTQRFLHNIKNVHDKTRVIEDEAYVSGRWVDTDSFLDYMTSMNSLANQAKIDPKFPPELKRMLLFGLKGCQIHSPGFLETVIELEHTINFNPECLKQVELYPNVDVPKLPKFGAPAVTPLAVRAALACESKYPQFNQSFLRSMWTKKGRPAYNVSGRSMTAYYKQVSKLSSNIVSPEKQWAPDLHLAMLKLLHKWGVEHYSIDFELDYKLLEKMLNKDTSLGYIPTEFLEIVDGSVQKAKGLKKRDVMANVLAMFKEIIDEIDDWIASDRKGPMPVISIVDVEMLKYEIRWEHDMMEDDPTPEEMDDKLDKVRLFYMSSIMDYILSVLCYKPISESVRFYESAIGIKVESGGLQRLFEILSNKNWTERQQELIDKWKLKNIDLTDTVVGQGDWSRYDQTLLAIILLFVAMFAKPFFVWSPRSGISPETMKVLYDQFVISVVQKVMFIYAHGTYESFGCMFSGKFITSIGDTIYQMLLKHLYLMELLKKYPDDALLMDIIEGNFIVFFFYGDDHIGVWPRVMHRFYLYTSNSTLEDFIEFCCKEFGMTHKQSEFKVCDNLYGERFFYLDDGVFVEDLSMALDSCTFLKNTVVNLHLDVGDGYVHVGKYPYRDTRDFACKLLLTGKSSGNLKTLCMSLMSFARLSSGNPEAYSMLKVFYDEIAVDAGTITLEDWDYYASNVGENSARRALKTGSFPSYEELLIEQNEGAKGAGFEPKDFRGNPSPESALYDNTGLGNTQSDHYSMTGYNVRYQDETMVEALLNFDHESVQFDENYVFTFEDI
jgi:hypothetical protein